MTGEDGVQPYFRNWKYRMSEFWVCYFCYFFCCCFVLVLLYYCLHWGSLGLIFIHISPRHILHVPIQIQSGSYNKLVIIRVFSTYLFFYVVVIITDLFVFCSALLKTVRWPIFRYTYVLWNLTDILLICTYYTSSYSWYSYI